MSSRILAAWLNWTGLRAATRESYDKIIALNSLYLHCISRLHDRSEKRRYEKKNLERRDKTKHLTGNDKESRIYWNLNQPMSIIQRTKIETDQTTEELPAMYAV